MQALPSWLKKSQIFLTSSFAPLFLLFIFALIIVIVQVQHQIRHTQTSYAEALQQQVDMQEQWRKLTLEKHHLTALARVESLAKSELQMKFKSKQNFQTIFLKKEPEVLEVAESEQKLPKNTPSPLQAEGDN